MQVISSKANDSVADRIADIPKGVQGKYSDQTQQIGRGDYSNHREEGMCPISQKEERERNGKHREENTRMTHPFDRATVRAQK
jgi:hypothetical protein